MVRGNWQKRVELAEARRKEAKQRKQKVADHRTVKQHAAELMQFCNDNQKPVTIFCETIPSDVLKEELIVSGSPKMKRDSSRRGRSNSNASSDHGVPTKKAHPRSRKNSITKEDDDETTTTLVMCRSYFFTGKCPKPCPYPHTSCLHRTVATTTNSADMLIAADSTQDETAMPALFCFKQVSCLATFMATEHLKPTDIVYAVQDLNLIYDRNAGGLLIDHGCEAGEETKYSPVASTLPGILLRHIVTFLPDEAVASMNAVCRDWRFHMNDPLVWGYLLERNQWPGRDYQEYVAHATVVRDMRGLVQQMTTTADSSSNNDVVLVTEYTPNQVLVILKDGTATLYDGRPKVLLQTSLDPYKHTKKRNMTVVAAALDDSIGLLCQVTTTANVGAVAYVLVLKQRDAFLVDDDEDTESTIVIDIGEAVLNYLLSLEVVDHRILSLMDFLQTHEFGDVEIRASHALAACGHGRFLVHVFIFIPNDANPAQVEVIGWRLILFSADAILWVGDGEERFVHDMQCRDNSIAICSDRGVCHGELFLGSPARICENTASAIVMNRNFVIGFMSFQLSPMHPLQTQLIFCPVDEQTDLQPPIVWNLENNVKIKGLTCIRENHLVVLCSVYQENTNRETPDEFGLNGGVFFMPNKEGAVTRILVVHIPTQTILQKMEFPDDDCAISMDYALQTIALASNDQIWLSGDDVRSARAKDEEANRHSSKKKTKRRSNRGGKKDGFARGMSLRG